MEDKWTIPESHVQILPAMLCFPPLRYGVIVCSSYYVHVVYGLYCQILCGVYRTAYVQPCGPGPSFPLPPLDPEHVPQHGHIYQPFALSRLSAFPPPPLAHPSLSTCLLSASHEWLRKHNSLV